MRADLHIVAWLTLSQCCFWYEPHDAFEVYNRICLKHAWVGLVGDNCTLVASTQKGWELVCNVACWVLTNVCSFASHLFALLTCSSYHMAAHTWRIALSFACAFLVDAVLHPAASQRRCIAFTSANGLWVLQCLCIEAEIGLNLYKCLCRIRHCFESLLNWMASKHPGAAVVGLTRMETPVRLQYGPHSPHPTA